MNDSPLPKITTNTPPIPANEAERLQALHSYCVLDTPPEPVFDDLTALAAALFRTPVALISLVDDVRQFFKSHFGIPQTESLRDTSFCTHAILSPEPLIVLDARNDPRFVQNPNVTAGLQVRFYAGAPLISPSGIILGTFCILDSKERSEFSTDETASLQRLAALASNAIEQRLHPARLEAVEREVLAANERYHLVTQATTEGIWDWNNRTGQVFVSARMKAIIGHHPEDGSIAVGEWIALIHPEDQHKISVFLDSLLTADFSNFSLEYRIKHQDGSWRWVSSRGLALRDADNQLVRLVGSFADITSTKYIDSLTGLHTRASLSDVLDHRIGPETGNLQLEQPFILLVINVDLFKRVNISLGREGGDAVLLECARRIAQTLSPDSTDVLARTNGDEFAILLNSIAKEEDAVMYAELLRSLLQTPMLIHGRQITMTTTMGIVRCSVPMKGEVFIQQAEAAAHQGKLAGGDRNVVFFQQMQDRVLRRMSLAADLREAIDAEALELYYQPKYNLINEEIIGFEALARWRHPVHGPIPPDEFISIAEESDLILDLGRWTLREAIGQLAEWRNSGLASPNATMAVNLSARQFSDGQLINNIVRKLTAHRVPASCLSLEVTEGILILDTEAALQTLRNIKTLGCGLDLDDFGTGYSSLSYLQRFPFDALKIDRTFVRNLDQDPDRSVLVRSIIALGHSLNLKVIAEGIETVEQLTMLKSMGCTAGQGYFFSQPLAPLAAETMLAARIKLHQSRASLGLQALAATLLH